MGAGSAEASFHSVEGKVAIVTGASRGIGKAIAEVYGANGMKVVCAARSSKEGQEVADAICGCGGEAIFHTHSEGGFLINVASVAGIMPQRGQALYTATKSGVVGMTKAAALDYAPYNITVNAICPGYTRTSIFWEAPEQAMAFFAQDCPAGRMGEPEECAHLALFLASGMARYITGAAIPVDGALSAGSKNVTQWKNPKIRE